MVNSGESEQHEQAGGEPQRLTAHVMVEPETMTGAELWITVERTERLARQKVQQKLDTSGMAKLSGIDVSWSCHVPEDDRPLPWSPHDALPEGVRHVVCTGRAVVR